MSIDAYVTAVTPQEDGTVKLTLSQPCPGRTAGQPCLIAAVSRPELAEILQWRHVWGGADALMCGEIQVGRRLGYQGLELSATALLQVMEEKVGLERPEIRVNLNVLQDGACRKYRQLVREIERLPGGNDRENLLHTAYKMGEFLRSALGVAWKMPDEPDRKE